MKKMKTLFKIDRDTGLALNKLNENTSWVFTDKAIATIKFDGTSCFFKNGKLYKRYDRKLKKPFMRKFKKEGKNFKYTLDMFKEVPDNSIPCNDKPDPVTLHFPYWIEVGEGNEDIYHREAIKNSILNEGMTYELVGPKIQQNPYKLEKHELWEHGSKKVIINDMSFNGLRAFLKDLNAEGIVWHNKESGEMVKLRKKDMFYFLNVPDNRRPEWHLDEIDTNPDSYKNIPDY